jgi:aminomethyltransferase
VTAIPDVHEDHGATFVEVGGRRVARDYGRPEREHLAVRRVVGLIEPAYGVVVAEDPDPAALSSVLTAVPRGDDTGVYAFHRDGDRVVSDAAVYHAGDRYLCFAPPDRADRLRRALSTAGADARVATDDFAVFGIHGPEATEKVASVLHGGATPEGRFSFSRGRLDEAGVTVVRTDAPAGEEGYEVVCGADDAAEAFDVLSNQGLNAAPFGYRAWETLTLEAGTPLFDPDLLATPPDRHVVGIAPERVPEGGAPVLADGDRVGRVTRAAESPVLGEPVALAAVDGLPDGAALTVRPDGDAAPVPAERRSLPFVEGSDRSGRIPPGNGD